MNSGSFFSLDLESSKVVEGIAIFNYIDLPELNVGNGELRYPVRLSISKESVSFFIHYFSDANTPHHSEEVILELPFGNRNIESLSHSIKRVYNTPFPLSNYLYNLLCRRYCGDVQEMTDYHFIRQSQINKDSYSSLSVWGLIKKQNDGLWLIDLQDNNKRFTKFLRKIILDFMFDLMHSDVFKTSKYYQPMYEGLMLDFFFSSIIKKSEYYYNRRLVRSRAQIISGRESLSRDYRNSNEYKDVKMALMNLYAEKLDESEKEWVNVIMHPLSNKHFSFTPEWYESVKPIPNRKNSFRVSNSWFVNPEEEMARVVFPLKDEQNEEDIHYLNSSELCNYLGGNSVPVSEWETRISKWFYRRFDFADTFRLHLFQGWNVTFFILLISFFIVSLFKSCLWSSPKVFALFPLVASLSYMFTTIILFAIILKFKIPKRFDDVLALNRRKRECDRSLWLTLFFLCVTVYFCLFESVLFWGMAAKIASLVIMILLLLASHIWRSTINNIHLMLPRLVASITTAWIMLVIGNDLIKDRLSTPLGFIIAAVVFIFVLYENNKTLPNIETKQKVLRTLELILISYSISVFVGVFAMDVLTPSIITDAKAYNINLFYYSWYFLPNNINLSLTIYPGYLIPFSFLAMFIGVFIQMIFEEKNITEM